MGFDSTPSNASLGGLGAPDLFQFDPEKHASLRPQLAPSWSVPPTCHQNWSLIPPRSEWVCARTLQWLATFARLRVKVDPWTSPWTLLFFETRQQGWVRSAENGVEPMTLGEVTI